MPLQTKEFDVYCVIVQRDAPNCPNVLAGIVKAKYLGEVLDKLETVVEKNK